jgi:4-amino-4-deoxy-L-arabinose transferase-like glycosyltransferase
MSGSALAQPSAAPHTIRRSTLRPDIALVLILLFGTLLRSQYLQMPMAEAHRWREVFNADIARNFAERSMNIFYPQVNWGGAADPYVGLEFPLMHWIVALAYRGFGEDPIFGRLVSIVFSVATIWAVFALGARLFGIAAGRAAAFLMAISPSAVFFGRFFISDTPMLFFSVAAVLAWVVYLETGATAAAVAGTVSAALAFLVKLPAVLILVPIAWAAWEARRWSALTDRRLVLGVFASLAATALWYWHADVLFHRTGLGVAIWHPAGMYALPIAVAAGPSAGVYNVANFTLLRSPGFYTQLINRIWILHLTPAGFTLALVGCLAAWRRPRRHLVDVWMAIVVLYILMTAEGNLNHEYYQLPLLPPAALFFGLAAAPAFDGAWLRANSGRILGYAGSAAALAFAAWLSFENSGVVRNLFRPDGLDLAPIQAGAAMQHVVSPTALVVTVEYELHGNNSPILLYWMHRRGWTFDLESISPHVIDLLRKRFGATYFVTTIWSRLAATHPDVAEYLRSRKQVPIAGLPPNTVLFDLTSDADAPPPAPR